MHLAFYARQHSNRWTGQQPEKLLALCWLLVLALLAWTQTARAVDFNVQNESQYAAMIDGVRAAEYTRQAYLEGAANPRALAAVVGLWVFAERNPLATTAQLSAFVSQYDAGLATSVAGDPDLLAFGSVLTAMSGLHLPSNGLLEGTDTRVGQRSLQLLGVSLPGVTNYAQSRLRMSRFDLASVQRLIQRRETIDALTALLANLTPDGQRMPGLAQIAANYLALAGFDPQLGQVDTSATEINAGLTGLPDYAGFVAIRDTAGGHQPLEQAVFTDIDSIQQQGAQLLSEIGSPEVQIGQFVDSMALTLAATDPGDPGHAAAMAEFEARRVAIIAANRFTAAQRAGVFARTLILQQSSYVEVRAIATNTRSFAALQLQTNNDLAIAQQGVQIGGSLIGVFAGFKSGDPWGAVQSITDVVTGALGLASIFGSGTPSAEEQIFDQIVELRQQVEDMRVQLNDRFDVVDAKLDQVFGTMTQGFAELGDQIGDLQQDVDALAASIAESRSSLDRIEDALFGFAQELLLADLSQQTNLALSYFNNNGISMPYTGGTPSFVASANYFFTFATSTSKGQSFAGTPDDQPVVVTLDNAASTLGDTAIARRLNDLRRVPDGLLTSEGVEVKRPITTSRVSAPAPWSQGAAAYLQLAMENPWYFNYQLTIQAGTGSPTRLDQIIADGERITGLASATRASSDLFDALLHRADQGTQLFQAAVSQQMDLDLPAGFSNGSVRVDAWGPVEQTVSALLLPVITVLADWSGHIGAEPLSIDTAQFAQRGQEISIADERLGFQAAAARGDIAERNALTHLFERGAAVRPAMNMWIDRGTIQQTGGMDLFQIHIYNDNNQSTLKSYRTISLTIETKIGAGAWVPLGFVPSGIPAWTYYSFIERAWPSLRADLQQGDLKDNIYSTGDVFQIFVPYQTRIRVRGDVSSSSTFFSGGSTDVFPLQTDYLTEQLAALRAQIRGDMLTALDTDGSIVDLAGRRLDNDSALLDAYLTIGMADAMTQSEMLRSAFRGAPGIGGLGYRKADVRSLIVHEALTDSGEIGGVPGAALSTIGQTLQERIGSLSVEIAQAANSASPSFPYVDFILGGLRELRQQALNLAIDETYAFDGVLSIPVAVGLLNNDVGQPGQINNQELKVDLGFFGSAEAIPPAHGNITVQANGAFTYTPNPGFKGNDRFTYRLRAGIPGVGADVLSQPATVVVRGGEPDELIFASGFED